MLDALKRHPVRTISIGTILLVFGFLLKYLVFWSPAQIDHLFASSDDSLLVVAHRGASEVAPENTLAASAAEPLRATLVNQRNGPAVFSAFRAYSDGW